MPNPPNLLDDNGAASTATALLMSHHAFRRDSAQFAKALAAPNAADPERIAALRQEWQWFRGALHGHHDSEDTKMFPFLQSQHPEKKPVFERLAAEHHLIDPLLVRGDAAFAAEPFAAVAAARVVAELRELLDRHLAYEEAEAVPLLRGGAGFPPPSNEQEAAMYAQGFAWSSAGIAPEVLAKVDAMLPEILTSRLPAARAEFQSRWQRTWGAPVPAVSHTSVPAFE